MQEQKTITSYKGFDKDLKCRDFQYEIGGSYEHNGKVEACESGFHGCIMPLSVFTYYGAIKGNRFAVVEQAGDFCEEEDKVASQKISIKAEIDIVGLVKAAVEWTKNASIKPPSGNYAHSTTTGNYAHSTTTGNYANSATTGNYANSATTGGCSNSSTTGDNAHSATTGYNAHSATTGNWAHSATTGYCADSATTGYGANSATTGNDANSATTGYYANSATTGDNANSATTGYGAHSSTTGDNANSATTGNWTHSSTVGKNAIAANAGNGAAKAGDDGAIFIVERDDDNKILSVFASRVGENGIKPDTWYILKDGAPVEVSEDEL